MGEIFFLAFSFYQRRILSYSKMFGITRCVLADIYRIKPMLIHRRTIGLMGKSGSSGRFILAGGLLAICSYLQYQFFLERREKVVQQLSDNQNRKEMPTLCKIVQTNDALAALINENKEKLILIDFHATWCVPCKQIAPYLESLAAQHPDNLIIVKIDVDEAEEVAMSYQVEAMPTFVAIKNGAMIQRFAGANKNKIGALVNEHCSK